MWSRTPQEDYVKAAVKQVGCQSLVLLDLGFGERHAALCTGFSQKWDVEKIYANCMLLSDVEQNATGWLVWQQANNCCDR